MNLLWETQHAMVLTLSEPVEQVHIAADAFELLKETVVVEVPDPKSREEKDGGLLLSAI